MITPNGVNMKDFPTANVLILKISCSNDSLCLFQFVCLHVPSLSPHRQPTVFCCFSLSLSVSVSRIHTQLRWMISLVCYTTAVLLAIRTVSATTKPDKVCVQNLPRIAYTVSVVPEGCEKIQLLSYNRCEIWKSFQPCSPLFPSSISPNTVSQLTSLHARTSPVPNFTTSLDKRCNNNNNNTLLKFRLLLNTITNGAI